MTYSVDHCEKQLVRVDGQINLQFGPRPLDHGALSVPGRTSGLDRDLERYQQLMRRRRYWQYQLERANAELSEPERKAAKAAKDAAHKLLDLRAELKGKSEVQWALNGKWYPISKVNKKTVRCVGLSDPMPAKQVGGAR